MYVKYNVDPDPMDSNSSIITEIATFHGITYDPDTKCAELSVGKDYFDVSIHAGSNYMELLNYINNHLMQNKNVCDLSGFGLFKFIDNEEE